MPTRKTAKKKNPRTGGGRRKKKQAPAVVGMDAFKTRERAEAGHQIPLYTPEGELSAHYITVRGMDSDEFQIAKTKQARVIAELSTMKDEQKREVATLDATCNYLAVLVKDWSFDKKELMPKGATLDACTRENVAKFLREAPQIKEKIEELVSRRALFFRNQAHALKATPGDSLS